MWSWLGPLVAIALGLLVHRQTCPSRGATNWPLAEILSANLCESVPGLPRDIRGRMRIRPRCRVRQDTCHLYWPPHQQTMSVRRRTVTCPAGPMEARDSLLAGLSALLGQFTVPSVASRAADAACGVRRPTSGARCASKRSGAARARGAARSSLIRRTGRTWSPWP